MRDINGETRRERNEAFELLSPEAEVPEAGHPLWDWFWDLRSAQAPGFSGPVPLSHQEMLAWLQLTGNLLRREDIAVLKAMDGRYCQVVVEETEAIRAREAG
ncbi:MULTISPECIES: phage tail assembly chaperone [Rhizobium]|uniref:Uncharacterized protein n=1 Tax=Rhizobium tropici TaxID=398 RepID=A0A6P1CBU7_RHITR|nr:MULTISPECIES: hypothetical protein [Rhizobium]AGB71743.1 hypothetical protein RTCIAT899_CH11810 [Rhizobium tropici CIAT 899]MBB4245130.1 hypothetical protein [Rhizobium tropici]MBB5596493.1 hypothetical protein [Rhizobium tropici]MBB6495416.1 hypothetical protein [Rhizobium tropici]NEV14538.1 hypothetical protein [Rhizobium tropici]